jgi:hypothetical protein
LKLFYFPDGKMQPGRTAGDSVDVKGAKIEELKSSGVWFEEKDFKKLVTRHTKDLEKQAKELESEKASNEGEKIEITPSPLLAPTAEPTATEEAAQPESKEQQP